MTKALRLNQPSDRSVLSDLHEFNLAFLLLARKIAAQGTELELVALGLDASTAERVAQLTDDQMLRLARSSQVMGRLVINDHALLSTLNVGRESGVLERARAALNDEALV